MNRIRSPRRSQYIYSDCGNPNDAITQAKFSEDDDIAYLYYNDINYLECFSIESFIQNVDYKGYFGYKYITDGANQYIDESYPAIQLVNRWAALDRRSANFIKGALLHSEQRTFELGLEDPDFYMYKTHNNIRPTYAIKLYYVIDINHMNLLGDPLCNDEIVFEPRQLEF